METLHFTLVSSETVDLTPALVEEFAGMTASPTEREINTSRINHLRLKIEMGLAMPFQWAKARYNGEWFRVNGQHSSTMLSEYGENLPEGLKAHIDSYEIADRGALALLFRQFDDRKSGRSQDDVSGAYKGLEEALSGVSRKAARLAAEGIAWYRKRIDGVSIGVMGDDRYQLIHEEQYQDFILWIGSLIGPKQPEMKKASLVSAMYSSWIADRKDAENFWKEVASGAQDLDEDHPAYVLSEWLLNAIRKDNRNKPKEADFHQAGVYAWNRYHHNHGIRSINISRLKDLIKATA